jgi:hypothetical protein
MLSVGCVTQIRLKGVVQVTGDEAEVLGKVTRWIEADIRCKGDGVGYLKFGTGNNDEACVHGPPNDRRINKFLTLGKHD